MFFLRGEAVRNRNVREHFRHSDFRPSYPTAKESIRRPTRIRTRARTSVQHRAGKSHYFQCSQGFLPQFWRPLFLRGFAQRLHLLPPPRDSGPRRTRQRVGARKQMVTAQKLQRHVFLCTHDMLAGSICFPITSAAEGTALFLRAVQLQCCSPMCISRC